MYQRLISSGASNNDVICDTFTIPMNGSKSYNVPTNSFGLIYLISVSRYDAYWVLDGTTLTRVSGSSTGTHVTYSNGTLTCGNKNSSGDMSYTIMIGDKSKFPSLQRR